MAINTSECFHTGVCVCARVCVCVRVGVLAATCHTFSVKKCQLTERFDVPPPEAHVLAFVSVSVC